MVRTIAAKELLEGLLTFRFVLCLGIVVGSFGLSAVFFVKDYRTRVEDYSALRVKADRAVRAAGERLARLSDHPYEIIRRPGGLGFVCEGGEKELPNVFATSAFATSFPELRGRIDFTSPNLPSPDWAFLVAFVLSFMALLMSYDAFSGERERGTLGLMLSSSVSRNTVLLGKCAGRLGVLLVALTLGVFLSLFVVIAGGVPLSASDGWRIAGIAVLCGLYLSVFLLIGFLLSTLCRRSASAAVMVLLVWVFLAFVIPRGMATVTARYDAPLPVKKAQERQAQAERDIWASIPKGSKAGNWTTATRPGNVPNWVDPPARAELYNRIYAGKEALFHDYMLASFRQVDLTRGSGRISPIICFQLAAEKLVWCGIPRYKSLYYQTLGFRRTLRDFLIAKDAPDPGSLHILFPRHPEIYSQQPVSYEEVPKFREQTPPLADCVGEALPEIGLLALMGVGLYAATFAAFARATISGGKG